MFEYDLLTYLEGFLTDERKQRFLEVLALRTRFLTVAIEDVFQLHNTSAVIRSCDAFGIQDVHVVEDRFGKRLDKNILNAKGIATTNNGTGIVQLKYIFNGHGQKTGAKGQYFQKTLLSAVSEKTFQICQ